MLTPSPPFRGERAGRWAIPLFERDLAFSHAAVLNLLSATFNRTQGLRRDLANAPAYGSLSL
jgi:hypothetical protein